MLAIIRMIMAACVFLLLSACADQNSNGSISSSGEPGGAYCKNKSSLCYKQDGKKYQVMKTSRNYEEKGVASWYGKKFNKKRTSSGERYNMYKMTAAHKTLPLSTYVQVTNLSNGKRVIVKVNDRGPFIGNRLIDLSYAAAKKLGMVNQGIAPVSIKAVKV
ncbi:RlpA-like protein [Aquicella siphonis]|uniref:Endolytic peptidoglycan transglycosylase RlpA n=1 Tax=Aquicella siphonis TaxID=254247 RepID=A0A5E4PF20_9COXI|nr:septal ring lytic transglycosylase RlpA family protein [Aquicella siphonis]VVC74926.1 RlpA-like protein [Aquicella siphonis]